MSTLPGRYRDPAKLRAKRDRWNITRRIRRFFGDRDTTRLSQMEMVNLLRSIVGLKKIPYTKRITL